MTFAEANYDLGQDVEWTMTLLRDMREEIRAERFDDPLPDILLALECARKFTRSDLVRRRCTEGLAEAEEARQAHAARRRA